MSPPLKFCFIPFYGAPSHSYSLTNIARYFAFHGQRVTILATEYNVKLIENLVRYDVDDDENDRNQFIDVRIVSIAFEELGLTEAEESSITPTKLYFANETMRPWFEEILVAREADERFDCIVADSMYPWTADLASRLRIPSVSFHPYSVLYACVKDVLRNNNYNKSYNNDSNRIHDLQDESESFIVPGLPVAISMTKSEIPPEEFCWMEEQFRAGEMKCDFVIVNNFKELESDNVEFYSKVTGMKIFAIGPPSEINSKLTRAKIGGKLMTEDEHHHCLNWLDKKDPESVLYVCFGSLFEISDTQMMELAAALESSGYNFILVAVRRVEKEKNTAIEDEGKRFPIGFFKRNKDKGLVLKNWAPQLSILNHPSVGGFLTHCGWNSILEGISAGVPMITWPLTCDQFCNEKLVTQGLGIGMPMGGNEWKYSVEFSKWRIKEKEKIELVIRKLMNADDEKAIEMRKKAREYGKKAKQALHDGGSTQMAVVDLIQQVRTKLEKN